MKVSNNNGTAKLWGTWNKNVILQRVPLFTLQGNLDVKKHGIYHSAGDYYRIRFDSIWSIQI